MLLTKITLCIRLYSAWNNGIIQGCFCFDIGFIYQPSATLLSNQHQHQSTLCGGMGRPGLRKALTLTACAAGLLLFLSPCMCVLSFFVSSMFYKIAQRTQLAVPFSQQQVSPYLGSLKLNAKAKYTCLDVNIRGWPTQVKSMCGETLQWQTFS